MATTGDPGRAAFQLPTTIQAFATALLQWYGKKRRNLPWREEPDPYRVWLSEVMLQQTRVKTALPYYERFLRRFPTLRALAAAKITDVLAEWAGLGYYSRARNLHLAAQIICRDHEGEFPRDYQQALALPGVGRYTAGAVLSSVYQQPLPILDGNIRRLLARYLPVEADIQSQTKGLWNLLEELVKHPLVSDRITDFNQALMELGALVCKPRNPACLECPLARTCRGLQAGIQDQLPRSQRSSRVVHLQFATAVIQKDSSVLLNRIQEGPLLAGFWDLPKTALKDPAGFGALARQEWGLDLRVEAELKPVRHQITHHKLLFKPFLCSLEGPEVPPGWLWADLSQRSLPLPSYVRKIERTAREWRLRQARN